MRVVAYRSAIRPNNHAYTSVNIFGNVASFNMLCLPQERKIQVSGLQRIENAEFHPLQKGRVNKTPSVEDSEFT